MNNTTVIYTDGSCSPNPGKGGWAFCFVKESVITFSDKGGLLKTTNNIMEMTGVIKALEKSLEKSPIKIFTDSQYVINCASGKWKRSKNIELWKVYDSLSKGKNISFEWVRGHNGDKFNEYVDRLANEGRNEL